MATTPGTASATEAATTAEPSSNAAASTEVADEGATSAEGGSAPPGASASLTQPPQVQAASPLAVGSTSQSTGTDAHSGPRKESGTDSSHGVQAASPSGQGPADPDTSSCAACAAKLAQAANEPEPPAPVPPITPAMARPTGPLPDFSAIDQATNKHVVYDESAVKEQEMLFKIAVRSEMQRLVVGALRLGAYILAALLVVRFWHLVGPSWARWLSEGDLQAMDKMLFSSAFGGFVLSYLKDTISSK